MKKIRPALYHLTLRSITMRKLYSLMVILIIIIIFYCGLMVHIRDTRSQKVVCYTSSHITETMFAHDQHWEWQSTLYFSFYAWCVHSVHIFFYTKAILMRRKYRNNSRTTTAFGLHHTGALNN